MKNSRGIPLWDMPVLFSNDTITHRMNFRKKCLNY
jgi:hypothetical protein